MIIVTKKLFKSQICRIISNLSLLELDLFYEYLFYGKLSILVTIVTAKSFSATFLIYIKTHQRLYLWSMYCSYENLQCLTHGEKWGQCQHHGIWLSLPALVPDHKWSRLLDKSSSCWSPWGPGICLGWKTWANHPPSSVG